MRSWHHRVAPLLYVCSLFCHVALPLFSVCAPTHRRWLYTYEGARTCRFFIRATGTQFFPFHSARPWMFCHACHSRVGTLSFGGVLCHRNGWGRGLQSAGCRVAPQSFVSRVPLEGGSAPPHLTLLSGPSKPTSSLPQLSITLPIGVRADGVSLVAAGRPPDGRGGRSRAGGTVRVHLARDGSRWGNRGPCGSQAASMGGAPPPAIRRAPGGGVSISCPAPIHRRRPLIHRAPSFAPLGTNRARLQTLRGSTQHMCRLRAAGAPGATAPAVLGSLRRGAPAADAATTTPPPCR